MPTKHPVKPSARNKKAAAAAKASRNGSSRPETPKRSVAKHKPADTHPREGEELYASLFRNNHAVMLIIDPESGRIVDANPAAVRFYGYTARKLKTLRISNLNMLDAGEIRRKWIRPSRRIAGISFFSTALQMARSATSK